VHFCCRLSRREHKIKSRDELSSISEVFVQEERGGDLLDLWARFPVTFTTLVEFPLKFDLCTAL
jgi:hypothetical protein